MLSLLYVLLFMIYDYGMELSIVVAFIAGLVSFLSPCVLPIIPGFLAYLAGSATDREPSRWELFGASLFFVLGFSAVFALLGVLLNSILENVAYDVQLWLSRLGGIVIIFFGLYLLGLLKIGFLEKERRIRVTKKFSSRYITSFVFGAAFAVGWTPCVGAALGAILALAATQPGTSFTLLASYAVGLGVPFLVVGLFAGQVTQWLAHAEKVLKWVNIIFGAILIILGILVFTQSLSLVANFSFLNNLLLNVNVGA